MFEIYWYSHITSEQEPCRNRRALLILLLDLQEYEYQSEKVPATDKPLTFILMPESSDLVLPASTVDKRMLAFNEVETEIIKYD